MRGKMALSGRLLAGRKASTQAIERASGAGASFLPSAGLRRSPDSLRREIDRPFVPACIERVSLKSDRLIEISSAENEEPKRWRKAHTCAIQHVSLVLASGHFGLSATRRQSSCFRFRSALISGKALLFNTILFK